MTAALDHKLLSDKHAELMTEMAHRHPDEKWATRQIALTHLETEFELIEVSTIKRWQQDCDGIYEVAVFGGPWGGDEEHHDARQGALAYHAYLVGRNCEILAEAGMPALEVKMVYLDPGVDPIQDL